MALLFENLFTYLVIDVFNNVGRQDNGSEKESHDNEGDKEKVEWMSLHGLRITYLSALSRKKMS